jgi:hypothetical protein
MALPAFMKKAFSRDGGDVGKGIKGSKTTPTMPGGAAARLAKLAGKNDHDGDEAMGKSSGGGKPKKNGFQFGKKKGGAMQAAALRMMEK